MLIGSDKTGTYATADDPTGTAYTMKFINVKFNVGNTIQLYNYVTSAPTLNQVFYNCLFTYSASGKYQGIKTYIGGSGYEYITFNHCTFNFPTAINGGTSKSVFQHPVAPHRYMNYTHNIFIGGDATYDAIDRFVYENDTDNGNVWWIADTTNWLPYVGYNGSNSRIFDPMISSVGEKEPGSPAFDYDGDEYGVVKLKIIDHSILPIGQSTIGSEDYRINSIHSDSLNVINMKAENIESDSIYSDNVVTGISGMRTDNGVYTLNVGDYLKGNNYLSYTVTVTQGSDTVTMSLTAGQVVSLWSNHGYENVIFNTTYEPSTTGNYYTFIGYVPGQAKILLDQPVAESSGSYVMYLEFFRIPVDPLDSAHYHNADIGGYQNTTVVNNVPVQKNIFAKKPGLIILRHDNYMQQANEETNSTLLLWLAVLDKYDLKGLIALNEQDEIRLSERDIAFWHSLQKRGHEISSHGMNHSNYWFEIPKSINVYTDETYGVELVKTGGTVYDSIILDTCTIGGIKYLTQAGFDLYLKRGQDLFKKRGLNPFTYWCEGGGQSVVYHPDSNFYGSRKNKNIGGSFAGQTKYKHGGYNPPLDWIGKSEYFMPTSGTECFNTTSPYWSPVPPTGGAEGSIKFLVDNSAKHGLSSRIQHTADSIYWTDFYNYWDSVCNFINNHPAYMQVVTGSQAAEIMYQDQRTGNCIPANPLTGQCFEDNIDAAYGDTKPDGWIYGWRDNKNCYWVTDADSASQGSKGCMDIGTTDTLICKRLYGIEKGKNTLSIDIRDNKANDTVFVKVNTYGGATHSTWDSDTRDKLTGYMNTTTLSFPSTASWTTNSGTMTIPYNCSFVDIYIWCKTARSYVDEVVLKKE